MRLYIYLIFQLLIECIQRAVLSHKGQRGKLANIEAEMLELLVLVTYQPKVQYIVACHWIYCSATRRRLLPQLQMLIEQQQAQIPDLSGQYRLNSKDVPVLFQQLVDALPYVEEVSFNLIWLKLIEDANISFLQHSQYRDVEIEPMQLFTNVKRLENKADFVLGYINLMWRLEDNKAISKLTEDFFKIKPRVKTTHCNLKKKSK